jgi:hypothetical protein
MYVKARIEHNCVEDEFFVADVPFLEIYKRATDIARDICFKNNIPFQFVRAAHPLMLSPDVREFLNKHADIKKFSVYTVVDDMIYLFSPETKEVKSIIVPIEFADKISL